jgi:hypothetical protein
VAWRQEQRGAMGIAAEDALNAAVVYRIKSELLGTPGMYFGHELVYGLGCEAEMLQEFPELGLSGYLKARCGACLRIAEDIDHSIPARSCQRNTERLSGNKVFITEYFRSYAGQG